MKTFVGYIALAAVAASMLPSFHRADAPAVAMEQETEKMDTVVTMNRPINLSLNTELTARLRDLMGKRKDLSSQLETEMSRRDMNAQGISEETRERLIDQRDSTCLSIQSQIVDIDLQIKEIKRK